MIVEFTRGNTRYSLVVAPSKLERRDPVIKADPACFPTQIDREERRKCHDKAELKRRRGEFNERRR